MRSIATMTRFRVLAAGALAVGVLAQAPFAQAATVINVGCTAAALVTAINTGNASSPATLDLAPSCVYDLTVADNPGNGLPNITGNVTIQGQGATIKRDAAAPQFRIVTVNIGATLSIQNVQIQDGSTVGFGGGISVFGTLVAKSVAFTGNVAAGGGAVDVEPSASATVSKSAFVGNSGSVFGGGGIIAFGTLAVTSSSFSGNKGYVDAGGIDVQPTGSATVSGSSFSSDTAGSSGGAITNFGSLTVVGSVFTGNHAGVFGGGAIYNGAATAPSLTGDVFAANTPNNCYPVNGIPGCTN